MLGWCEAGFVNYMKKESYIFKVFVPLFNSSNNFEKLELPVQLEHPFGKTPV